MICEVHTCHAITGDVDVPKGTTRTSSYPQLIRQAVARPNMEYPSTPLVCKKTASQGEILRPSAAPTTPWAASLGWAAWVGQCSLIRKRGLHLQQQLPVMSDLSP